MRLFLCWVCPPLAVLSCGRPFSALLNFFLVCLLWYPGVVHAHAVVERYYNDQRSKKMIQVVNYPAWAQHVFAAPQGRKLKLPAKKSQKSLVQAEEPVYNDPAVGENGTRFRRRGRS
jgi:uncharacterized membrane protein YqaE (UPF0057 family)